jgi:hypothetical protein
MLSATPKQVYNTGRPFHNKVIIRITKHVTERCYERIPFIKNVPQDKVGDFLRYYIQRGENYKFQFGDCFNKLCKVKLGNTTYEFVVIIASSIENGYEVWSAKTLLSKADFLIEHGLIYVKRQNTNI